MEGYVYHQDDPTGPCGRESADFDAYFLCGQDLNRLLLAENYI